jgi:hypothetical protein
VVWFGLKKTQNRQIDLRYLADLSELLSAPNASIDASNGASFECWPESWRAFWGEIETPKFPRSWDGFVLFGRTGLTGFSKLYSGTRKASSTRSMTNGAKQPIMKLGSTVIGESEMGHLK